MRVMKSGRKFLVLGECRMLLESSQHPSNGYQCFSWYMKLSIHLHPIQGVSDHGGVLLDVEWVEKGFMTQEKWLVPIYHKTNVLELQNFLRDIFPTWANNSGCIEDIRKNFKDIVFEGIKHFVVHKILKLNPDPEYYNKEVKRLKLTVRRAYNRRKLGEY